jgi:hypothetical protein
MYYTTVDKIIIIIREIPPLFERLFEPYFS